MEIEKFPNEIICESTLFNFLTKFFKILPCAEYREDSERIIPLKELLMSK